jgi:hypothetical protein
VELTGVFGLETVLETGVFGLDTVEDASIVRFGFSISKYPLFAFCPLKDLVSKLRLTFPVYLYLDGFSLIGGFFTDLLAPLDMFRELSVLLCDLGDSKLPSDAFPFGTESALFSKFLNSSKVIVLIWLISTDGCMELEPEVSSVPTLSLPSESMLGR